jgi:hypothetical protein
MHQFRSQVEIVEAGLALLWLDNEIFEFPWHNHRLGRAFATRAWGFGLGFFAGVLLDLVGLRRGNRSRRAVYGDNLGLHDRFGWGGGSGNRGGRHRGERLDLAFTEHLFKCFKHGHLIN